MRHLADWLRPTVTGPTVPVVTVQLQTVPLLVRADADYSAAPITIR